MCWCHASPAIGAAPVSSAGASPASATGGWDECSGPEESAPPAAPLGAEPALELSTVPSHDLSTRPTRGRPRGTCGNRFVRDALRAEARRRDDTVAAEATLSPTDATQSLTSTPSVTPGGAWQHQLRPIGPFGDIFCQLEGGRSEVCGHTVRRNKRCAAFLEHVMESSSVTAAVSLEPDFFCDGASRALYFRPCRLYRDLSALTGVFCFDAGDLRCTITVTVPVEGFVFRV